MTLAETTAPAFEHLVLDFLAELEFERGLSRNTLEAYRSDLLQFGAWLGDGGSGATTVQHADLARFLDELAAGCDGRPPVAPAPPPPRGRPRPPAGRARHAAAQGGVPALLLPPPAPRERRRARPHRGP